MNAINLHNDSFFKALQSNAVLIDSDLVGAARLLWTARAAELNLDIYRKKLSFHFRGDQEEVYQRIEDILRQQYAFAARSRTSTNTRSVVVCSSPSVRVRSR